MENIENENIENIQDNSETETQIEVTKDESPVEKKKIGRPKKYDSDDINERIKESKALYNERKKELFNSFSEEQKALMKLINKYKIDDIESMKKIIESLPKVEKKTPVNNMRYLPEDFDEQFAKTLLIDKKSDNTDYEYIRRNRIKFKDYYLNFKDGSFIIGHNPRK